MVVTLIIEDLNLNIQWWSSQGN